MNISELRSSKNVNGHDVDKLEVLLGKTGNCVMNGYLGTSLVDCSFDENGLLEFYSTKRNGDTSVDSIGCVLDDSVLIKQVQKGPLSDYCKLYSWSIDEGEYTYLEFDDKSTLNNFYGRLKKAGANLCDSDLSTTLGELGLTFDNVTQVLIKQKVDPITVMMDEEMDSMGESSLVL